MIIKVLENIWIQSKCGVGKETC